MAAGKAVAYLDELTGGGHVPVVSAIGEAGERGLYGESAGRRDPLTPKKGENGVETSG